MPKRGGLVLKSHSCRKTSNPVTHTPAYRIVNVVTTSTCFRNARERRRVQAVNNSFARLRRHIPYQNRNKRLSKVKTLKIAIDYINHLQVSVTSLLRWVRPVASRPKLISFRALRNHTYQRFTHMSVAANTIGWNSTQLHHAQIGDHFHPCHTIILNLNVRLASDYRHCWTLMTLP